MPAVERYTAPFQYALKTRAGTECAAHVLQALTEADPNATVLSIDGISAYDLISRRAILEALRRVPGGDQVLPFVRLFYDRQSTYLWEDDAGTVHHIVQGEGGEQGDPLMPLLFALGQHGALQAVQNSLGPTERLLAFLDDVYTVTTPERVAHSFATLQEHLHRHANIRVHLGKIKVWNASGVRPRACDAFQAIATGAGSLEPVWKGSGLVTDEQGIKVLGTPLGHEDFVAAHLHRVLRKHQTLLERIPVLQDIQSAWTLLLHSASSRANYQLRVVRPELTEQFAAGHDDGVICLISPDSLGGWGLRSALRTRQAAYWASWADTLSMVRGRHRAVADTMVTSLTDGIGPPSFVSAERARRDLSGVMEFEPPTWLEWRMERARHPRPRTRTPSDWRAGWQHEAASRVEAHHRASVIYPGADERERALVRSQSGPLAGVPFSTVSRNYDTRLEPHLFTVLLLRRLRLPLPPTVHLCRCGSQQDSFGHHRAACAQGGWLARRGFAVEIAAAKVRREAGARVSSNITVRDLDLPAPRQAFDGRRLEVVAEGLPIFGCMQLAIDTTLVCALHRNGTARRGAAARDGVALHAARRRKERTYPELVGPHSRARLVVLAGEVGGRSAETAMFLHLIAKAKAKTEPPVLRLRAELAWRARWDRCWHVRQLVLWRGHCLGCVVVLGPTVTLQKRFGSAVTVWESQTDGISVG